MLKSVVPGGIVSTHRQCQFQKSKKKAHQKSKRVLNAFSCINFAC
jgi:hypothetical protein